MFELMCSVITELAFKFELSISSFNKLYDMSLISFKVIMYVQFAFKKYRSQHKLDHVTCCFYFRKTTTTVKPHGVDHSWDQPKQST